MKPNHFTFIDIYLLLFKMLQMSIFLPLGPFHPAHITSPGPHHTLVRALGWVIYGRMAILRLLSPPPPTRRPPTPPAIWDSSVWSMLPRHWIYPVHQLITFFRVHRKVRSCDVCLPLPGSFRFAEYFPVLSTPSFTNFSACFKLCQNTALYEFLLKWPVRFYTMS